MGGEFSGVCVCGGGVGGVAGEDRPTPSGDDVDVNRSDEGVNEFRDLILW